MLQSYVRYYWVFKSNQPINTLTFPLGCPQIIFHKKSPLYIPELKATQEKLTVSGQVNFSSHLYSDGDIEMIVVVFQPHAMSVFLDTPTSLFYNQEISGYNLENKSLNELAVRISECKDNTFCVNLIEQWLLSQITVNLYDAAHKKRLGTIEQNFKRVDAAIKSICVVPQTSVTELSSIACLSNKQFERLFNYLVGINPKEYARIVRFQKALGQMQNYSGERSQAQIAHSSGYADQSHFIREFKKFSGHTPVSLLKVSTPYSDLFTNPI
ncbi:MAG TPA: helix-turn-helix domain-containing protein [Xylanibacter oryzae]|nr:helix-turn-helix domain-containing protein [Xylanibacter oryzae]